MADHKQEINPGGINGTGKGIVNTNSKDFKGLQQAILEHASKQTSQDRMRYELTSLRLHLEAS